MAKAAKEKGRPAADTDAAGGGKGRPFLDRRTGLLALALVSAALVFAGVQLLDRRSPAPVTVGTPAIGGPFSLVDHEGRPATDADFRERFMLVFFGYSFCPDVCPTALSEMANALDMLGAAGDKIIPVFITVDPERDRPEHLKEYLGFFHPRTVGLTGTPDQVAAAAKAYKVYYKKQPPQSADAADYLMDHTAIVYLMGPDGKFITHFSHGTAADVMAAKIRKHL